MPTIPGVTLMSTLNLEGNVRNNWTLIQSPIRVAIEQ